MTAKRGREPGLKLSPDGRSVDLSDWAREIVDKVAAVAELIDRHEGDGSYRDAVSVAASHVGDPESTPSARLLRELVDANCSFFEFATSSISRRLHQCRRNGRSSWKRRPSSRYSGNAISKLRTI